MEHTTKVRDCAQEKNGVRMIGLRLPESEYQQVAAMAKADRRAISSMARVLVLRAMGEAASTSEANS